MVIMAVPDRMFGTVAAQVVPLMRRGAMLVCLDPAGPHAGLIPAREDISVFVCHPAHPVGVQRRDGYGSPVRFLRIGKARQPIVCALMQGPEERLLEGRATGHGHVEAGDPCPSGHRGADGDSGARFVRDGRRHLHRGDSRSHGRSDRTRRAGRSGPGFPARPRLLALGIVFDRAGFTFSDGAKKAIEKPRRTSFSPTGRRSSNPKSCVKSVAKITGQVSEQS